MRTFSLFIAATFLSKGSSSVSPIVGLPSVIKMTKKGRLESSFWAESARSSASSMFVPPIGLMSSINSIAFFLLSLFNSLTLPKSEDASVEKGIISKRSFLLRFSTQKRKAFFACSSFSPAIDPDLSITKTISLATTSCFEPNPGLILIKK